MAAIDVLSLAISVVIAIGMARRGRVLGAGRRRVDSYGSHDDLPVDRLRLDPGETAARLGCAIVVALWRTLTLNGIVV